MAILSHENSSSQYLADTTALRSDYLTKGTAPDGIALVERLDRIVDRKRRGGLLLSERVTRGRRQDSSTCKETITLNFKS